MKTRRVTFFSRTTSGAVKTWSCWIEADGVTVTSEWGIKNGKMQRTSDTLKRTGRKTAVTMAEEEYARQIQKKQRAGYVEAEARAHAVQLEKLKTDLDFNRLPRTFAPAKPIREIALADALTLERQRKLYIQRKRDGMRHYIVAGLDGRIRVFSRGMDDKSEHYARFTQELTLPPGTILDAEFVVQRPDGSDDFKSVSEICRALPERAKRTMVQKEHDGCVLKFVVFDLLFYDRLPTWQLPYSKRYASLIEALIPADGKKKGRTEFSHVTIMPLLEIPLREAIRRMQKHTWEGLVLWRSDQATQVHMNRSPKRCNCYKFKPMREGDFIATGFDFGKGRHSKVVGALHLALYDPKASPIAVSMISGRKGNVRLWKRMGNVGTGFSDVQRREALKWIYPCVVEVQYEKMSDTGLRFPSFLRQRLDKRPKECRVED